MITEQLTAEAKASQLVLSTPDDAQDSEGRVQLRDTARQSSEQLELPTHEPTMVQFNGTMVVVLLIVVFELSKHWPWTTLQLLLLAFEEQFTRTEQLQKSD
jgi:hypothetical protein